MQSIQFKRTGVTGKVPTPEQLQVGEIAIQLADHVIFTKDKEHKVVQISVSPETHEALESKVDANKKELDQTIALNDQNINSKVDEIKTATDATITANDEAINTKVDKIKRETDATILANKNTAASDLAAAKDELNTTIEINKTAAATATSELDTRINKKVDDIKKRTDATIKANDTAINEKVDTIKRDTDRTIEANAEHAQNQLDAVDTRLTGVIEANKNEAAEAVTALSKTVEAKDTAIHKKVDGNKAHADSEISRLDSRIDMIDGSSDGKFIKMNTPTVTEGHLLSRTANYEAEEVNSIEYADYFGAIRVNGADNWSPTTGVILNVPHAWGKAHGRGFEFQYGSAGSQVRTYGFGADGIKAFSHKIYHEGDKPTPAELNVYSKEEVNRLFQKSIYFGNSSGWFKIASVNLPQIGTQAFIRLYGGNGFNAGTVSQTNVYELVIRSSNANPHGLSLTVYRNVDGADQDFCAVHTSEDMFDIYAKYFDYSAYVMAEYGEAGATLTVYDTPERFDEKPTGTVFDASIINMFNSYRNRGTLSFQGNGQGTYDIEQLNEQATEGKNYLRRFRSSAPATIWHETIEGAVYRLSTGFTDAEEQFSITGIGGNKGGHVSAGRFTARGGNNGFNIHYDPATESAMFQIHSMPEGSLNAYFGYGSNNVTDLSIVNSKGRIVVATPNSDFTLSNTCLKFGNSSTAEPSNREFRIRNWGTTTERSAVFEVDDGTGWHFYSQRMSDNRIEFAVAQRMTVGEKLFVHGDSVSIRGAGNSHVWYEHPDGREKVVTYAEESGAYKIRTTNQRFSHTFYDGMIQKFGELTVGGDKGLIRGEIQGGAWVDWRDRAAGLLVDCQDSQNQAYNIWKATHWGSYHIAAMGVHAGGGNAHVVLHVGGADYNFAHNGDFTAGAAVYCNDVYIRSDRRLKINVEDYTENAVDKINKLTVKTYDKVKSLKDREVIGHEIGIIAQDLQEVLPEAVSTSKIGNPDEPDEVLTVSNSAVNALLIKAVQEMSKRIEYLESLVK
ncbi:tail fiber domain-containing protein [Salmonella enterica]|nr:tail fiber domain-containing protein [Salmonella enterica]EHI7757785.1 tail fiber domain-containing protein [Salmonella enterica]EHI8762928.1 tail fiber domain-containing protein [Salmonella enterica]